MFLNQKAEPARLLHYSVQKNLLPGNPIFVPELKDFFFCENG
jgi:hypothetical protein